MSIRLTLALPVVLLAACATPQENPIYQYSSVYDQKQAGMATQDVSYRDIAPTSPYAISPAPAAPAADPVYSRVSTDCIALGTCQPVGVAETTAPTISEPWASPTEERFAGGATTPGFRALEGSLAGGPVANDLGANDLGANDLGAASSAPSYEAEAPLSMPAPLTSPAPLKTNGQQAIDDIPTLTISGPIHAAEALSGTQSHALMHRVQPGDTVYSLARDYCADVEAIRTMNRLNASYAISLGQDLKLPANCQ